MSRSHRVWSDVYADNYSTGKSFGGEFSQHIAVGSSAKHSNAFADISVNERSLGSDYPDWSVFILVVDGVQIKRAVFNNKTKAYGELANGAIASEVIAALAAVESES